MQGQARPPPSPSKREINPPLSLHNKWKWGERVQEGSTTGRGAGEVVCSLKRDNRMGIKGKEGNKTESYKGAGSECPPNSSDVSPRAHHFRRGRMGERAGTDALPSHGLQPSPSLTWLRAQPGPKEGSRRNSSYRPPPPRLSAPSSRAQPVILVAPNARRRLSERQRPGDRH